MSDEYTPPTVLVRRLYVVAHPERGGPVSREEAEAEFDRWLAAHDREVIAEMADKVFTLASDAERKVVDLAWDPATTSAYLQMAQIRGGALDAITDAVLDHVSEDV